MHIFGLLIFLGAALAAPFSHALTAQTATLKNGMQVVVVPDHRTPMVINSVWYNIGAADEVTGKTGLAHMLEHMMFKGTEDIPPQEFSKIIARHGGQDNAFTSYDYTAYYQKIATAHMPLAMKMEADRMANLQFTQEQFTPEKQVVREERRWRIDSKPKNRFFEELARVHMPTHPYGRPVIGFKADMEAFSREDALAWYTTYYAPNNATLIVVGDTTLEAIMPVVEKTYGQRQPKKIERPIWPIEPAFDAHKRYEKVDEDVKVPLFVRTYRAPSYFAGVAGAPVDAHEVLALAVMADVFGNSATGFLYERLVKELKIADSAHMSYGAVSRGESSLDIMVQPKPGVTLAQIEKAVEKAVDDFMAQTPTARDVARVVAKMKSSDVYAQDDPFGLVYRLGRWLVAGGRVDNYDDWLRDIETIAPRDVARVAQTYFTTFYTTGWLAATRDQFGLTGE